jgi:hypothetical protein
MGASNVAAAFVHWSAMLDDQPMRALLYMANVALDPPQRGRVEERTLPCRYFGGWESLSEALGNPVPPAPADTDASADADDARRRRETAARRVRRAITALRRAGAIEDVRHGGRGVQAEYLLRLGIGQQVTERPAEQVTERPAEQVTERPAEQVTERPSQEQQRSNRGTPEERDHLSGGGHLGDRPARDKQMSPGVGPRAALAVLERAGGGEPPHERPPWCGACYEPTRLRWSEPPDGGECLGRCPVCHPLAVRR